MNSVKKELADRITKGKATGEECSDERSGIGFSVNRLVGFIYLALLLVILCGITVAGKINIVHTEAGYMFYSKPQFSFKDTYVDLTELSFGDLKNHEELFQTMIEAGDGKFLPGTPSELGLKSESEE
ncbi:MAG: hypothetical protein PVI44_14755 [Balneolaceae bacterium]|jgi:hypothetical protein